MKFLTDILTEKDNATFCLIKCIAASGTLTYLGCAVTHVVINHAFDYTAFGTGLGAIMGGGGLGVLMKDK